MGLLSIKTAHAQFSTPFLNPGANFSEILNQCGVWINSTSGLPKEFYHEDMPPSTWIK